MERRQEDFSQQVSEIVKRREELYRGLQDIDEIRPFPYRAIFIFFRCAFDSYRIYENLVANGVVVKNWNNHSLMTNCIRVTAGNGDESTAFLTALKSVLS